MNEPELKIHMLDMRLEVNPAFTILDVYKRGGRQYVSVRTPGGNVDELAVGDGIQFNITILDDRVSMIATGVKVPDALPAAK